MAVVRIHDSTYRILLKEKMRYLEQGVNKPLTQLIDVAIRTAYGDGVSVKGGEEEKPDHGSSTVLTSRPTHTQE
ncbi:MAG: hypothetical protein JRD89_14455 [Deltaproteobacteria bacterium]|nr:hypothetical protein [Deltaproteobacteria bacterium]